MFNQGWMVIDVDLEDANGTIFRTHTLYPNPYPNPNLDPNPNQARSSARASCSMRGAHMSGHLGYIVMASLAKSTIAPTTCASSLASRALEATVRRTGFRSRACSLPSPSTRTSLISLRYTATSQGSRARATASSPPSSLSHCTACATTQRTAWPEAPPLRYRS